MFPAIVPGHFTFLRVLDVGMPRGGAVPYSVSFFEVTKGGKNGKNISVSIEMGGNEYYDYKRPIRIKLLSIPEELYNFEKSLYTYWNNWHDPFSEPVYLDSNIKGGYGIFAVCRSKEISVSLPWE